MQLIIIEGNISSGKTTLAKQLEAELGYAVFLEPTITNPYLSKYYADPKEYGLKMQLWLLRQRFRAYVAALRHIAQTGQGVVLDRSIFSDWVFAEKNRLDGNISAEGFDYYMRLRSQMLEALPLPSVVVYLDVDAQVCYDRVHKMRQRECESGIPLAYLAGLDSCYRIFNQEMKHKGCTVFEPEWANFGDAKDIAGVIRDVVVFAKEIVSEQVRELLSDADSSASLALLQHEVYGAWYTEEKAAGLHSFLPYAETKADREAESKREIALNAEKHAPTEALKPVMAA